MGAQARTRNKIAKLQAALKRADADSESIATVEADRIHRGAEETTNSAEMQKLIKLLITGADADEAMAESGANLSISDLQKIKQIQAAEVRRQHHQQEMELRADKVYTRDAVELAFDGYATILNKGLDRIAKMFIATSRLSSQQAKEESANIQKIVDAIKTELLDNQKETLSHAVDGDQASGLQASVSDDEEKPSQASAERDDPDPP